MSRLRKKLFTAPVLILLLVAIPILAEEISDLSQQAGFTQHDLAYYLDPSLVNFVRPGLQLKIVSAAVQGSTISVRFTLTDPKGLPLDRLGITTPGAVSTSFIAAYIPKNGAQYTAYTTRTEVSPDGKSSALQAGTDSGGSYTQNGDGDYTYTFKTPVPATYDPSTTHTIGMYASRNLSEFNLGTQYDNAVFTWVPNGGQVTQVRDVVRTENCNQCHDPLAAHGGARRKTELCILCHTQQTTDAETGNTVDFKVMIHKIHNGDNLPSVKAGKPYQIIGFNNSVNDFSTVAFPNDVRNCNVCHKGGTQSTNYLTKPTRAACGSCHDDVNFATGQNHSLANMPQVSDNLCSTCHIPQGELEFDASILGGHTVPRQSAQLSNPKFSIISATGSAGQSPTVTFSVTDKSGQPMDITKMNFLNLLLAGPTTDFAGFVSEDARKATPSGNAYVYTFNAKIPPDGKGTYAVGIEGYINTTINAGTVLAQTVRDVGFNQVTYLSVDGSPVVPRRKIVALDKCNTCHGTLALHGTIRRNTEFCVLCHNPNQTDAGRRKPEQMPAQSVNFKNLIHKIHTGEDLKTDFTVFGFGGNPINFNEVRFPGDRRDCEKCHNAGTQNLPLPDGLLSAVAPRDYINPMPPVSGACLACHTEKSTAAHASVMTSPTLGESCDACHGNNADFSVAKVHAR